MRSRDLEGFGPVGTNGPVPTIDADLDTMRDVYMLPSQQAAFDRLASALRALRDAPVVRVSLSGEILTERCKQVAGQRVRLVVVGEDG